MDMCELELTSPKGIIQVMAKHDTTGYCDDADSIVRVTLTLEGMMLQGEGDRTEAALIDLVKKLPAGYGLRSCLSCRHGNFCPVGDEDNEIFCVNDFAPKGKGDLFSVTEDSGERAKRSRTLFCCCDRYAPQTEAYYTYNDFLTETRKG